ncbi:shufflon system plasmid conjugative transfer pilus tip adhesin PilV [Sodalis endosymbiont of Spalangia cameroni]|uniref:shufflon system plasmid conjugative transfer pilus tip adhesin PilV n=1 Tax=Sodalis praecaptivus TaxID=1239307 RepID=UPI0031F8F1D9
MARNKQAFPCSRVNRGVSLAETMMVMTLLSLMMTFGVPHVLEYQQERAWDVSATTLSAVSAAARRYIRDNKDTLTSKLASAKNVVITGKELKAANYLPPGFSLTTGEGQSYLVAVTRNVSAQKEMMAFVLTTAGTEIPPRGLRYIAQNISGLGGYIWPMNQAVGANGSWNVNLTHFGLSGQQGRLAVMLSSDALGSDSEAGDRLYRFAVDHRPDLNQMHTALSMGDNDINKARNIHAQNGQYSGNLTANKDIRSNEGWIVTRNNYGWLNETHGGGFYMSDNDWVRSVNNKGIYTGGQLKGGTVRADGRLSAGEFLQLEGTAQPGWGCGPNGLVGRTPEGALLSCQYGVWKGAGIGEVVFSQTVRQWQSLNIGRHAFCALARASYDYNNYRSCQIARNGDGTWQLTGSHVGNGEAVCQAVCF